MCLSCCLFGHIQWNFPNQCCLNCGKGCGHTARTCMKKPEPFVILSIQHQQSWNEDEQVPALLIAPTYNEDKQSVDESQELIPILNKQKKNLPSHSQRLMMPHCSLKERTFLPFPIEPHCFNTLIPRPQPWAYQLFIEMYMFIPKNLLRACLHTLLHRTIWSALRHSLRLEILIPILWINTRLLFLDMCMDICISFIYMFCFSFIIFDF